MNRFEEDTGLPDDHKAMCCDVEDLLREADHRSIGGFQTEDQKFAYEVQEILKEVLCYFDRIEDSIDTVVRNARDEVAENEYTIDMLNKKLNEIAQWVTDQQNLKHIMKIINNQYENGY